MPLLLVSIPLLNAVPVVASSAQATSVPGHSEITQYPLPAGSSQPWTITSDQTGRIWFVEQGSNQIGSYFPSSGTFAEYNIPTPSAFPEDIAADNHGNIWFTELTPSKLGELRQGASAIIESSIPSGPGGLPCGPIGVTPAVTGIVWLTCEFSNQIDEYFPSNGTYLQFNLPIFYSAPLQILFDRAGNFWFTAADADMLGYAITRQLRNGTTDGIQEFAPNNDTYETTVANQFAPSGHVVTSLAIPSQIAFSPDESSLWITEHGGGSFDRYDIGSKVLVKYFTSRPANQSYPESLPNGIMVDSSGDVWVAEHYGNKIAEFNPVTKALTEYSIPCCRTGIANTLYLTLGANGTVWFSEFSGNAIAELRPTGSGTEVSVRLTPTAVAMAPTGEARVNVTLSNNESNLTGTTSIALRVAGISRTGELENLTATFGQGNLTLRSGETTTTILSLKTNGLRPGAYYLTVGATSSEDNVTSGVLLQVVVQGPPSRFQNSPLVWLAVGGVASIIALVLAISFLRRRTRHQRD